MTVPFVQKALHIDLETGDHDIEHISASEGVIGPVDFGWREFKKDKNVFTFGEGKLASSTIPGSRRLVFCAYSDQWEGFYISSMGGAAHKFQHVGVSYVSLRGRAERPSALLLNNRGEAPEARIVPLEDYRNIWAGYENEAGEKLIGIYAMQQALLDLFGGEYDPNRVRIVTVGPSAEMTVEGVIGSNTIKKGVMQAVVDWAGRGGLGSRLFRHHNILAIMFGGEWKDAFAPKTKELNHYFEEHYGDKMTKVDMAMTKKYHYDPKLETGGTFGANYTNLKDKILTFNYRSAKRTKTERIRQHTDFIVRHYLKQFNEETIKPKRFDHCGEPCSVACKKLFGKYKKDYEPYHALGPQCGVFDQRAAELLNDHADAMGFDAIQIGGTLAWIMECVADGLMDPDKYGFPPASELKFSHFTDDVAEFDLVEDSMRNARYAMKVIDAILSDSRAEIFRDGLRAAAENINSSACFNRAVYLAHGEKGCMVPNQYWVPGMGSPMPLMGKYYVYYGSDYLPPDDLGRKNVERMVHELINDNCGECRFHRGWSEALLPVIMNDRFGLNIDFKAHHFNLAREINEYQSDTSQPWATRRMAEMLEGYLTYIAKPPTSTEEQAKYPVVDPDDPIGSAKAFWRAIKEGQERAFRAGPDAISRTLTPKQQKERFAGGE